MEWAVFEDNLKDNNKVLVEGNVAVGVNLDLGEEEFAYGQLLVVLVEEGIVEMKKGGLGVVFDIQLGSCIIPTCIRDMLLTPTVCLHLNMISSRQSAWICSTAPNEPYFCKQTDFECCAVKRMNVRTLIFFGNAIIFSFDPQITNRAK